MYQATKPTSVTRTVTVGELKSRTNTFKKDVVVSFDPFLCEVYEALSAHLHDISKQQDLDNC